MNEQPTILDLFSGIGGFSLGFESAGFRTVAFSEIDPEASRVLKHWWPDVPNLGDIRGITGEVLRTIGPVDGITGGVPCQPASALGQMRGAQDERWLWPETIRLVGETRPVFGVFENPPSLAVLNGGREFNGILSGLSALGYDLWWDVIPAAAVGAGHLRERLILVATDAQGVAKRRSTNKVHAISGSRETRTEPERDRSFTASSDDARRQAYERRSGELAEATRGREGFDTTIGNDGQECAASNSNSEGLEGYSRDGARDGGWEETRRSIATPDLRGRVSSERWWHEDVTGIPVLVHGISNRLAEASCRCTGNAIVPQVAQVIAFALKEVLTRCP